MTYNNERYMLNIRKYALQLGFVLSLVIGLIIMPHPSMAEEKSTKISAPKQAQETIGELWTGSVYTSTFRAGACIAPDGKVNGVLLLKLKNGQVDTYHFYGTMDKDGIIRAKHHSGYKFKGRFDSAVKVSGEATLNNGFTIDLEGDRFQNTKLTERCGPLPE